MTENKQSGNGIGAALGVAFGAAYGISSANISLIIAMGLELVQDSLPLAKTG